MALLVDTPVRVWYRSFFIGWSSDGPFGYLLARSRDPGFRDVRVALVLVSGCA